MSEAGGQENLAASVLSSVLGAGQLESPNDNETLSPLLEVVDNLEEDREAAAPATNLNLKDAVVVDNSSDNRSAGLDVVSLASTLASDLAHLVESMNLADRASQASTAGANANMNRPGRPITSR